MTENIANFCVELDAIFNDGGLKEASNSFKNAGQEVSALIDNLQQQAQSGSAIAAQTAFEGFKALRGGLEDFFNFTSSSFLDLDKLIKGVWNNMVNSFFEAAAKMAAESVLSSVFGGAGIIGGIFGGVLGSRRSGGAIDKTGPYYLHEGEFVLPPEVVSAVKSGRDYGTAEQSSTQNINITLNTPVTVNGTADKDSAQKLCEEISRAARRGVSWAVEQAKISYKIGRERSSEVSL